MYNMLDECPICLEEIDISNNIIITLECCKKHVHLDCIKQWSVDINNKNKNLCLLCRKSSDFLEDLYNNLNIQPLIDNSNSEIHYIQIDDSNNVNTLLRTNNNNKRIILLFILIFYLSVGIIIYILIDNFI